MSKLIPLTKGKFAIVDDDNYNELINHKWFHSYKKNSTGYAIRHGYVDGKRTTIRMHRDILKAKSKDIVDHIDMNGLNNTKSNLRICTNSQNAHNSKVYSTNTSGFKGVTYSRDRKGKRKYITSYISYNDKPVYLGRFKNEIDAAIAYDKKAIEIFGEFALTNERMGLLK